MKEPRGRCRQIHFRFAIYLSLVAVRPPALAQVSEFSHPLTSEQVACDQARLERLEARMVMSPFLGNLVLWRSGRDGGRFGGLAATPGFFGGGLEPRRHQENELAFDLSIEAAGDFLNPRRPLLPQALLARRNLATTLHLGATPILEATLDLAPNVPNQFLPRQPIRIDSRSSSAGAADGAGRGLAIDDLAAACHGDLTDFDLRLFEILSRTLRVTRCLTVPDACLPSDESNYNVILFRGEAPGTYRANLYLYSQDCEAAPCETSAVFARLEVEVAVDADAEGRLGQVRARFLPFCGSTDGGNCTNDRDLGPWAVFILPPIWAGHEVQGEPEFRKGGFLNLFAEGLPGNVLSTTFDGAALLAGTAWSGPLR